MNQTLTHLSHQGINNLIKQQTINDGIIVQIVEFQVKKEKLYVYISDGQYILKAMTKNKEQLSPQTDLNSIIRINKHMMGKNNVVGIADFEKLYFYKTRIGNPDLFTPDTIANQQGSSYKIDPLQIKNNLVTKDMPSTAHKSNNTPIKQTNKPIQLGGGLNQFQTIKNLYIGMERWTVVCRIVKLSYSQFISKGGKQTKILNVQLIDRTGMKMSGTFFGEAALHFKDLLLQNRVYKISKGQIRQESYNNSRNQKISPFKLVFTMLSSFEEVSDTSSIAKNEDSAITLGDCIQRRITGQQFDVICILIKIQQTVDVKTQKTSLRKTNLLVADPIKNVTLHAVVWAENLIPFKQLEGKSIILSRFKLNDFKGSLNLSSYFKSSIFAVKDHSYQSLQSKVMKQFQGYEKLYEIKQSSDSNNNETCITIRQLQRKISNLGYDQWARADVNIHIIKFNLKKWHYQGCPHCSKLAQSLNNCPNCQKYVQNTIGHFIMGVQICDSTGSLWTTAYDQWAKKIFHVLDQAEIIRTFAKLTPEELKQQTEKYIFQDFKVRIGSKKDKEGKIKHIMMKNYQRTETQETQRNIQLISKLMIS